MTLNIRPARREDVELILVGHLARERNCGRVEWSVLNWNQSAIDFYESLGATPVSGWTVYRITGEALEQLGVVSTE